ncbi:MAG: PQQ-dependent sugar dehydrogenase, partial [Salinispira sp.]
MVQRLFPHSALLLALLLMIAPGAQAQTTPQKTPQTTLQTHRSGGVNYHVETLVPGLTFPWSVALVDPAASASGSGSGSADSADSAPSAGWVQNVTPREAFVTIRSGELLFFSNIPLPGAGGEARVRRVSGLPAVSAAGQGGLLDIVLSPHFARNSRLYFSTARLDERALSGTAVYTAIFD